VPDKFVYIPGRRLDEKGYWVETMRKRAKYGQLRYLLKHAQRDLAARFDREYLESAGIAAGEYETGAYLKRLEQFQLLERHKSLFRPELPAGRGLKDLAEQMGTSFARSKRLRAKAVTETWASKIVKAQTIEQLDALSEELETTYGRDNLEMLQPEIFVQIQHQRTKLEGYPVGVVGSEVALEDFFPKKLEEEVHPGFLKKQPLPSITLQSEATALEQLKPRTVQASSVETEQSKDFMKALLRKKKAPLASGSPI
jgi:hypothetical protein